MSATTMAFCRNRLLFEAREETKSDRDIMQTLNFDSDEDEDYGVISNMAEQHGRQELLMDHRSSVEPSPFNRGDNTPEADTSSFWDSGLCSPTPKNLLRRRSPSNVTMSPIPFGMYDSDDGEVESNPTHKHQPPTGTFTPPHKKLRSLRLYDTPHTPKSLLQKAQRRISKLQRLPMTPSNLFKETPNRVPLPVDTSCRMSANVNPFTPVLESHSGQTGIKRSRPEMNRSLDSDEDFLDDLPCTKKLALHDINTSRYHEEFLQTDKLGDGEFGAVYKCIHRLDGCTYAIKKSKTPVAGSVYERTAMNEVYAHAVLGKHPHVVRYFSAWAENDHMYIQNEYCNGGSLADVLSTDGPLSETQLKQVLLHVAKGLRYIHSQRLVHLDIKPGNIFIHSDPKQSSESGLEEDIVDDETQSGTDDVTYKVGDLGHVTAVNTTSVEEGDCRYLPGEILRDDFSHLPKADVFSLALTIWEAGTGEELPKNGDMWHAIRQGDLPPIQNCSGELNELLREMIQPDPRARPSSHSLCQHPFLCPFARKTRQQLRQELNQERFKNELLTRQLKEAKESKVSTHVLPSQVGSGRSSRIIGKKVNRSMSLTCF